MLLVESGEETWLLESLENLCFLLRFSILYLLLLRINVNNMAQNPAFGITRVFHRIFLYFALPVQLYLYY